MIESKSFGSKAFKVINAIILILLAFSCFYPLWYTFCVSISSKAAAEGGLVTIYPIGSNVKSYSLIMGDSAFWNSFWISIKRVVIGTVWTMVVLIMMSYPLAKSKTEYKPRNVLMWILVFCMLFNGGTIPWFITVKNYGRYDGSTGSGWFCSGIQRTPDDELLPRHPGRPRGGSPCRRRRPVAYPVADCSSVFQTGYRNHRPLHICWLLERVFPGPGINEQRDELSVTDLHPSDLRSDPGRRNPDCRAVSAVSTEL